MVGYFCQYMYPLAILAMPPVCVMKVFYKLRSLMETIGLSTVMKHTPREIRYCVRGGGGGGGGGMLTI